MLSDSCGAPYETLEDAFRGWHQGTHDPRPYINYVLYILVKAYMEFETRAGQTQSPRGTKTELVLGAIERSTGTFRVADLQRACPGVSLDMIRRILNAGAAEGRRRMPGARARRGVEEGRRSRDEEVRPGRSGPE